jgi:hypothetical protein
MKLDVQNPGRPIIRLHDFDHDELQRLRASVEGLAAGTRASVSLHEEAYVQPLEGCRFTLRVGEADQGIERAVEPNLFGWVREPSTWEPYACTLTRDGWSRVASGVDLLLHLRFLCSEYVWLHKQWNDHGTVAWLLSPDGEW